MASDENHDASQINQILALRGTSYAATTFAPSWGSHIRQLALCTLTARAAAR